MSAVTQTDLDSLAQALAQLLVAWWRLHEHEDAQSRAPPASAEALTLDPISSTISNSASSKTERRAS